MEPATTKPAAAAPAFPIEKVRAAFPALEREVHGRPVAYLDSGASAQRVLASIQAVDRYERAHHSNVHRGSHTLSAEATAAYEGARATVADHLGAADRREVVFVRNATEAINLVARAWGDANVGEGDRIVLTEMEHHSNVVPWQQLAERAGAEVDWVPVGAENGLLDMDVYAELLERDPKLVAVAHVSNVLGTENPVAEIARLAHDAGALVLVDGAQAAPKLPLDVTELGADFYALTGHKLYAPTGIGALWARLDLLRATPPFLGGGSMIRKVTKEGTSYADPPARFEAGTPAIAQAIGMASALRWLDGLGMSAVRDHERAIAGYALERLAEVPGLRVFGPPPGPERLGPVSFELEGVHAHDVSEILDRHGVAVRAGHHCAQPLMDRLGIAATARASFGVYTTEEEIDRLVEGLHDTRKVFGLRH
jgi:cysteine desulfurase/selenocysteine lyase